MPRIKPEKTAANFTHRLNSDWCPGCGLYRFVNGEHRQDCTKQPADNE